MSRFKDNLQIVDVRVHNIELLPQKYFLAPETKEGLRLAIVADVLENGAKVPAGAEAVYAKNKPIDRARRKAKKLKTNYFHTGLLFYVIILLTLIFGAVVAKL